MLLRCELLPGARISERELCTRFAVSRTPLREALKVLAASHLVELLPNRGAWVPHLRVEDVADVFALLAVLERQTGELAAPRILDRDVRDLSALHARLVAQVTAGETEQSIRTDIQFHRKLVDIAGSPTLSSVHEGLAVRVERARYIVSLSRSRMLEAVAEHEAVLEAVRSRDAARIADALHHHSLATSAAVIEAVRTRFGTLARRTG